MIGLTIIQEWDIDDGYELVTAVALQSTSIRRLHRGTGLLEEERVWVDWSDNRFGKRGYAQMIYYTT